MGDMMRFVDLFCGIGGFHAAMSEKHECVFACDIDRECREVYKENWSETPSGDIRDFSSDISDHEILCAGFPCQPFSKSGSQRGFQDKVRGTLFGEISKIIQLKKPKYVLLENVANLESHDNGQTLFTIKRVLRDMNYFVKDRVLSPHEFGIPHHRPRIFIVAINKNKVPNFSNFRFPKRHPKKSQKKNHINDLYDPNSVGLIEEKEFIVLNHWTDFMHLLPKDTTPPSPTWSMEFGRSYSLEDIHPVSKLSKERLCEELAKEKISAKKWWNKERILLKYPPYIRKMKSEMPEWKKQFILKNRKFWKQYGGLYPKKWLQNTRTFSETHQKFEWHVGKESSKNIMDHMIHIRPSGIRVSRLDKIPALVAISQIPIIGPWKRRLTPREAANAQSFPDDFILHPKNNVAFKQLGNSVNVELIKKIIRQFEIIESAPQDLQLIIQFHKN